MNKRTNIILCSILAICAMLICIAVCYIFARNGYCFAWKTPIDHEGTATFVGILSLIIIPTITLISVFIYYATLREQREHNCQLQLQHQEQIQLLQSQHFIEQWQVLVTQQIAIRDNTTLTLPILQNALPAQQTFTSVYCFKMIWVMYIRLVEAIKSNYDCSNWEQIVAEYDGQYVDLTGELACMEHYEPEEYAELCKTNYEKLQIAYVGYCFDIQGNYTSDISPTNEAFRLIYERYFRLSSTYYSHLCSMLLFLQKNEPLYSDQKDYCIAVLKYNLCRAELSLIKQYAEYDKENKELILKYLFK